MRKFWLILSAILTIGGLIFAYGRRYIGKLSFDVDLGLKIIDWKSKFLVAPLWIYVDNKNKKGITVKNLYLQIYSIDNILLAETDEAINKYKIEGYKNNKFEHNFKIHTTNTLVSIIKNIINNVKTEIYMIASFDIFGIIPISIREEIIFN